MSIDANSLNEIKNSLKTLDAQELRMHLLRLAKYKKENKELLSFILYLEGDMNQFLKDVKHEMDEGFSALNTSTSYISAKGLRKVLKMVNKYIKFSADKNAEVEWLIHFCKKMKASPVRIGSSVVLTNLYNRQVERIYRALEHLHDDQRADFRQDFDAL